MASAGPKLMVRDVDFLPMSYRDAGIQRKNVTLRVAVVTIFVALIGLAAIYQQRSRLLANWQLVELMPHYEQAKSQRQHLADLQLRLQAAERRAELCAYLRHPWPRSQIVAAVVERLPEEIELTELSVLGEPVTAVDNDPARVRPKSGESTSEKIDGAQRDLESLRGECSQARVVVKMSGATDDSVALHRYLEQLEESELLVKVEVGPIERTEADRTNRIHFQARIFVRPSYGEPSGPKSLAGN